MTKRVEFAWLGAEVRNELREELDQRVEAKKIGKVGSERSWPFELDGVEVRKARKGFRNKKAEGSLPATTSGGKGVRPYLW